MHIHRFETGMVEGPGHLQMAVNALLAQNRHRRAGGIDEGSGDIFVNIEGGSSGKPRITSIEQAVKLTLGAVGVVAQRLQTVAGFRPGTLRQQPRGFEQRLLEQRHTHLIVIARAGDHATGLDTGRGELCQHFGGMLAVNLNYRSQLLGKQCFHRLGRFVDQPVELDLESGMGGKGHFQQRNEQATIAAIVISEQLAIGIEPLNYGKECLEILGIIEIGALVTELAVNLRQRRATQTVLAAAQVDQ